jgi:xanthine dehydrogenase YagS FAD-binding subunit
MRAFEYSSGKALPEVVDLMQHGARPLAGGTDLLPLMKLGLARPGRLVDIKRVAGLSSRITFQHHVSLGALTTLAEIESHPEIVRRYAVLAQAAAAAATPQLRNVATLGGNLLQRTRCWYFRNAHVQCWLKGGSDCPARDGENRLHAILGEGTCRAVHPSDLAPALLALDAEVQLRGPRGERRLPLAEFFAAPADARRTETTLADDELIAAVHLPPLDAGTNSAYLKAMDRKAWAFALVSCAVVLRLEGRRICHARVVLGGVAARPWRAAAAEERLLGAPASEALLDEAAAAALQGAVPLRHNAYKEPLARALLRRALGKLIN